MTNEVTIESENTSPSEQTPGDHGEVMVRRSDTEALVNPKAEYQRPTDSESALPRQQERTILVDDPRDPAPHNK
jgi:hypothetical protein